jgi:hypoxanthine phosphoribosyltransferase
METQPYPPHIGEEPTDTFEQPFEYRLLHGHATSNGTMKTDEQLRMEYITRTDHLIDAMTHGVSVQDPETKETRTEKPDCVIFLDKSARPLAWFVDALWDKLAPEAGSTEVPKKPEFKFLNIDRNQWVNTIDPEGVGTIDVDKVDTSVIRSLRSIFIEPKYKRNGLTPDIDSAPTQLDHKTVLIIDEVNTTGRTLQFAKAFIKKAFPTTKVAGMYWMQDTTVLSNGYRMNADAPVWYKQKSEYGRGVGNRYDNSNRQSVNLTQRLGAWFLSSRFPQVDQQALQLRREMKQLANYPDVPMVPSMYRDDYEEKLAELNGDAEAAERRIRAIGRLVR